MSKFPSIYNVFKSDNISRIDDFFNTINTTWTIQRIDVFISGLISYGGKPENILYFIINDRIQSYASLLMNGVKDEDAFYYNYDFDYYSEFYIIPMDVILTFRALVPIVGYYYANNFILNKRYNLDDYPFFVEIASQMNSRNFFHIDKCLAFSKTGGSLDKVFTLRNRKRRSEE